MGRRRHQRPGSELPDPRIQYALELIESNLSQSLSLLAVTRELRLSPSHFQHLFKAATGTNFRTYRKQLRLRKAAELLLEWDLRVCEVGQRVGYANPSNFSRDFGKFYGMSPMTYRRRNTLVRNVQRATTASTDQ